MILSRKYNQSLGLKLNCKLHVFSHGCFNLKVTWGCEGKVVDMETEEDGRRFYYSYSTKGKKAKVYCQYDSRKGLEDAIIERRTSLVRAIEIYMEEVSRGKNTAFLSKAHIWQSLNYFFIT